MDRMEILKLALASTKNAAEAMKLAKEMAAFVQGADTDPSPPAEDAPRSLDAPMEAPKVGSSYPARAPKKPNNVSDRSRKRWTEEEKERAAAMLDAGASYADTGKVLGRSDKAIMSMRVEEKLPVKKHQIDTVRRLSGAIGAITQGFNLGRATHSIIKDVSE